MSAEDNPFDGLFGAFGSADEQLNQTFGWYAVAKKEFQDALRSRGFWLLAVLFTVLFINPVAQQLYFSPETSRFAQEFGMQQLIQRYYLSLVTFLLPIVAIFAGYAAISKEQSTGSIKVLLSLPHSRREVIVGKIVGRCGVVGVPLLISFGLTALFIAASSLKFKAGMYVMWAALSLLFTLVIVAVAVSLSGALLRNIYSLMANIFFYFEITFLWNLQVNTIAEWVTNNLGSAPGFRWQLAFFAKLLNPSQAYKTVVNSQLIEGANAARSARWSMFNQGGDQMTTICTDALNGNATVQQTLFGNQTVCQDAGQSIPLWLSDPAVIVYLTAWIGLAAAISYYTFDKYDL